MFSCKIVEYLKNTNKKIRCYIIKNNITKTLVPLYDSFNSSFNGSFYLRFKKIIIIIMENIDKEKKTWYSYKTNEKIKEYFNT